MTSLRPLIPRIRLKRGDNYNRSIRVIDDNNELVNWSGGKIFFTVRETLPDYDNPASPLIEKELEGNATGIHDLTITPEETRLAPKTYKFEIRTIDPEGFVFSTITGDFLIEGDLTILEDNS